ncbi:MAG: TetR/AcrR family transcriptional regulator, partial [Betaproteobacteria bacterium]|nr:TetR/AcrR family transcriptional regulator [Betaproteobacteria bacterium]
MPTRRKPKPSLVDLRLPQAKALADPDQAESLRLPESQRLDPDVRRQQILEAAISYFAEAGFAGQTRELSKRIGVTQSLLYRYYPSKQDLIEAVFEAVFLKPWNPAWTKALQDRSKPLRDRLIDFYSDYAKEALELERALDRAFEELTGEKLSFEDMDFHVDSNIESLDLSIDE